MIFKYLKSKKKIIKMLERTKKEIQEIENNAKAKTIILNRRLDNLELQIKGK